MSVCFLRVALLFVLENTMTEHVGGYQPIEVHDPGVKEAAIFAVETITKVYHPAQLQRVLYAENKVINGIEYHLLLAVVPLPVFHVSKYDVIVRKSTQNMYTLVKYSTIPDYIPGGYSPVDINDPEVKDAAKYAISILGKLHGNNIALEKIVSAASQVVAGTNFHLVLEVKLDQQITKYDVTVFRSLFGSYELTSHHVSSPEPQTTGGFKTISAQDSGAKNAAKAAIEALSHSHKGLCLARIISAEVQVVAGLNYNLELELTIPPTTLVRARVSVFRSLSGDFKMTSYHPLENPPGGYIIADVNSQDVRDAAKFTVESINKLHSGAQKLELTKILSAETQVVAGLNIHLTLELNSGNVLIKFEATVFRTLNGEHKLVSHHVVV